MQTSELIKKLQGNNTNAQISDISGFHVNTISQWRTGKNEPNYFNLATFAQSCGYEIEFMKNNKLSKIEKIKQMLEDIADSTTDDLELNELESAYVHITSLLYIAENNENG
jgi:transcriptional regulator with XRE-family HTH domain